MGARLWAFVTTVGALARTAGAEPIELADIEEIEDVEDLALSDLLEQPVVAASRYAQKPASSPTLVSSVDAELIERLGYRSVGEALRGMRGVYVSNDRDYSYIGVRGLSVPGDYNTRISLAVDGHRINDPVYQQAALGIELGLPMIAIDHIEMLRGGAWSVHGESALLGAVEVVTASGASRPGLRVATTTRIEAETSEDPSGRPMVAPRGQDVAASYGVVSHGFDVFAAASYLFDRGLPASYTPEFDDPALDCVDAATIPRPCDGIVHGNDGEQAGSAYLVVRSRHLAIHALAARRIKSVATASFATLIDASGHRDTDHRLYADAEYKASGPRGDLIGRIAGDYYGYIGDYPFDAPGDDAEALPASLAINRDFVRGLSLTGELRGRYKIPRLGRHVSDVELAVGGELGLGDATQRNYDRSHDGELLSVALDRTDRSRMAAVTLQATARVVDHVVAFAAVRGDYYPDSFGGTANPQGGLVLDGGELGRVRVSWARGFRAPNAYERYYAIAAHPINPDLGPERSDTREISVERYLGKRVRTQLVAYTQRMTDLIALTTDDTDQLFVNHDAVRAHGVEAELEGRWSELRVRASYAWQHSSDQDDERPVNSPSSVAQLSLLAPILRGRLELGFESYYVSARLSSAGASVPGGIITNVSVTARDVIDQLDVTLGASNLFDARRGDPGSADHLQSSIPQDPRIVWLRLQLDLGR